MKTYICDSKSGDKDVCVKEYKYKEFIAKYWPESGVGENICREVNSKTGKDEVIQYEKYKIFCCDYCSNRVPPFITVTCSSCCNHAHNKRLPFTYPECGKCERCNQNDDQTNVYLLENVNMKIRVGNRIVTSQDSWGICEACFKRIYKIKKEL